MDIIVPKDHPFNGETELAMRGFVIALDGLPPPRKMETGLTTFGLADQVSRMALDALGIRSQPENNAVIDMTPADISRHAISRLRDFGMRVGPFRKRKIKKLTELEEPFSI